MATLMDIFADNNKVIDDFFASADRFVSAQKEKQARIMSDAEMDELEQHFGACPTQQAEPEPFAELSVADQVIAGCWVLFVLTVTFLV